MLNLGGYLIELIEESLVQQCLPFSAYPEIMIFPPFLKHVKLTGCV